MPEGKPVAVFSMCIQVAPSTERNTPPSPDATMTPFWITTLDNWYSPARAAANCEASVFSTSLVQVLPSRDSARRKLSPTLAYTTLAHFGTSAASLESKGAVLGQG